MKGARTFTRLRHFIEVGSCNSLILKDYFVILMTNDTVTIKITIGYNIKKTAPDLDFANSWGILYTGDSTVCG